jgi:hypothetical protein
MTEVGTSQDFRSADGHSGYVIFSLKQGQVYAIKRSKSGCEYISTFRPSQIISNGDLESELRRSWPNNDEEYAEKQWRQKSLGGSQRQRQAAFTQRVAALPELSGDARDVARAQKFRRRALAAVEQFLEEDTGYVREAAVDGFRIDDLKRAAFSNPSLKHWELQYRGRKILDDARKEIKFLETEDVTFSPWSPISDLVVIICRVSVGESFKILAMSPPGDDYAKYAFKKANFNWDPDLNAWSQTLKRAADDSPYKSSLDDDEYASIHQEYSALELLSLGFHVRVLGHHARYGVSGWDTEGYVDGARLKFVNYPDFATRKQVFNLASYDFQAGLAAGTMAWNLSNVFDPPRVNCGRWRGAERNLPQPRSEEERGNFRHRRKLWVKKFEKRLLSEGFIVQIEGPCATILPQCPTDTATGEQLFVQFAVQHGLQKLPVEFHSLSIVESVADIPIFVADIVWTYQGQRASKDPMRRFIVGRLDINVKPNVNDRVVATYPKAVRLAREVGAARATHEAELAERRVLEAFAEEERLAAIRPEELPDEVDEAILAAFHDP